MEGEPMADPDNRRRLQLWAYLTTPLADEYIRIMRLLAGDVLAPELTAAEIRDALTLDGVVLTEDDVEDRCRYLAGCGNINRSPRRSKVATIAEIRNERGRYQASKLGARVSREADGILAATDGAREVSRELLGVIAEQLDRVIRGVEPGGTSTRDDLAAAVTTVFNNHRSFVGSLSDFYGYLTTVLSRFDLVGEDYLDLKVILLNYVELIRADVQRFAPVISERLTRLEPLIPDIVEILQSRPTLNIDGDVERSPGLAASDWTELSRWYIGTELNSGPARLRLATDRALGQLLLNAKRIISDVGSGMSRRDDLLRLAATFSTLDEESAHRLFADTFGAYSWRHVLLGDREAVPVPAHTSWWDAEPVDVPVSLRERGDRKAHGRTSAIPDMKMEAELSYLEAVEREKILAQASCELIAAGDLTAVRLSGAARELFLTELTRMSASAEDASENTEAGFIMERHPSDAPTVVRFDDGDLTIHGYRYAVTAVTAAGEEAVG